MLPSYSDVFGISHAQDGDQDIHVGDVVCTGDNQFPQYAVVALSGDKAWLRNLQNRADYLVAVNRCRRLQREFAVEALTAG